MRTLKAVLTAQCHWPQALHPGCHGSLLNLYGASQVSSTAAALVDLNERALALRTGGMRDDEDGASGPYGDPSMAGQGRVRRQRHAACVHLC